MVCHRSVLDGFPQPDTRVLYPATPPHPAKATTQEESLSADATSDELSEPDDATTQLVFAGASADQVFLERDLATWSQDDEEKSADGSGLAEVAGSEPIVGDDLIDALLESKHSSSHHADSFTDSVFEEETSWLDEAMELSF